MIEVASKLNLDLFHFLHDFAGQNVYLDAIIIFFAKYYILFLIVLSVYVIYHDYRFHSKKRASFYSLKVFFTLLSTSLLTFSFRSIYHHDRPFVTLSIPHLLFEPTYSFPSGHTIFAFGLATAIYFSHKRFAYVLFGSGLLIGLARIMAGVHYPFDIFGGIMLGILTGVFVERMTKLMKM